MTEKVLNNQLEVILVSGHVNVADVSCHFNQNAKQNTTNYFPIDLHNEPHIKAIYPLQPINNSNRCMRLCFRNRFYVFTPNLVHVGSPKHLHNVTTPHCIRVPRALKHTDIVIM